MKTCALCGGNVKKTPVKDYVYDTNLGDVKIKGTSHFPKCEKCKNVFIPGSLMERWNRELLKKLAAVKRILAPKEIIFVFSTLPYSQNEIAGLVGRDRSTLSKYKTGENRPDYSFDFLLKKIMLDFSQGRETTIEELRSAYNTETDEKTDDEITSLVAVNK